MIAFQKKFMPLYQAAEWRMIWNTVFRCIRFAI